MKNYKAAIAALVVLTASTVADAQIRAAQKFPDYQFTVVKENPITPVKNQYRSGTCWAYSTIGFVESEVIRLNKIKDEAKYPDFSEMFVVSHSYSDRALKYVYLDGNLTFGAGSEADDVLHVIRDYGIVPQAAMTGMNYGTELPVQGELDAVLKAYVEAVVKNPNRTLTTAWHNGFDGILQAYLGAYPETFEVDGKSYTPASYRDALKFNPDDYVSITSFTHHPFYTQFAIEICDNWRWDRAYNVPIDEFMAVIDNAVMNGYTLAWGSDVSEPGFTRDGLAILVNSEVKASTGSDQERWVGKANEPNAEKAEVPEPVEYEATQEFRQIGFNNKSTTDDHGMQIYGIAKDQNGKKYYMVKNSWGASGKYAGLWYATESFVAGKSMDVVVHKDALPKELKAKLGIK
ncbi:MAG: aminopeptidase [Bacteroidales bacterium]|nr:aminopeptidase [Candidatus Cryptobacteroides onthequi]MCQ2165705.1 aminopeptidase [Bacteroidales bacterium]